MMFLCDIFFTSNAVSYHFIVTVQVGNRCIGGWTVSNIFNFLQKNPIFLYFLSPMLKEMSGYSKFSHHDLNSIYTFDLEF